MSAALALYRRLQRTLATARKVGDAEGAVDALRALEAAEQCLTPREREILGAEVRPSGGGR